MPPEFVEGGRPINRSWGEQKASTINYFAFVIPPYDCSPSIFGFSKSIKHLFAFSNRLLKPVKKLFQLPIRFLNLPNARLQLPNGLFICSNDLLKFPNADYSKLYVHYKFPN